MTTNKSVINGRVWIDEDGNPINAHGGGLIHHDGFYFWFGEVRIPAEQGAPTSAGVACYSSKDLLTWRHHGIVLPVTNEAGDLQNGCVIERPKVIYNRATRKFVMWFHLELKGRGYDAARCAVAVSDFATGPYQFLRSMRPNAARWPREFIETAKTPITHDAAEAVCDRIGGRAAAEQGIFTRRDFAGGQMARDMTLFVDSDGVAYLIAAAEENFTLAVHQLDATFTAFTGDWARIAPGGHNEAPAIVKVGDDYHLLASGCSGWAPNAARSYVAPSVWGPWQPQGNPCVGTGPLGGSDLTFGSQSTFLLRVPESDGLILAGFDVWRPENLPDSGYIWLPACFDNGRMRIEWDPRFEVALGAVREHAEALFV